MKIFCLKNLYFDIKNSHFHYFYIIGKLDNLALWYFSLFHRNSIIAEGLFHCTLYSMNGSKSEQGYTTLTCKSDKLGFFETTKLCNWGGIYGHNWLYSQHCLVSKLRRYLHCFEYYSKESDPFSIHSCWNFHYSLDHKGLVFLGNIEPDFDFLVSICNKGSILFFHMICKKSKCSKERRNKFYESNKSILQNNKEILLQQ